MKFFKKIWTFLQGLFATRSPSEEEIISDAKKSLEDSTSEGEILDQIQKSQNSQEKENLLNNYVNQRVAAEIINYSEKVAKNSAKIKKGFKKLYDFHELKAEFQRLERQKALLTLVGLKIQQIRDPYISMFDDRINKLATLLNKNKLSNKTKKSELIIPDLTNSYKQLEALITKNSVLNRYKTREQEKKKQQVIYENNINKKLGELDSLIGQNKLNEAKLLIDRLSKSIKPDYKKGVERLSKATTRLKEKELEDFKKDQTEFLRKQQEEAEKIRIEQEKIIQQQKNAREQLKSKKKLEEEKKQEKKKRLEALLTKKSNWRDFQRVLQENGITVFYHFTDYSNLKSIEDNDGLYSWHYADSNGIVINFPGGDIKSRELDKKYGLHDYVRVSLCPDHPMQYRLNQAGRKLALLEIDVEVAYYENTIFCNINAADSSHQRGTELDDLKRIRFSATKKRYVSRSDPDFKYHQAEILVKTWISLNHIKNIKNIIK